MSIEIETPLYQRNRVSGVLGQGLEAAAPSWGGFVPKDRYVAELHWDQFVRTNRPVPGLVKDAPKNEANLLLFWKKQGKELRKISRAQFRILHTYPTKTSENIPRDAAQRWAWWHSVGRTGRKVLRQKWGQQDDLLGDFGKAVGSVASKAVDIATLRPILKHIPILKEIQSAGANLLKLPVNTVTAVLSGKRIDKVVLAQFSTALASAKTLAPYVQTVISFVPGIGTGLSAGIGGAMALASGKPIDEAFMTALKSAIPGGPVAQAAFAVAEAVVQGKPIEAVALSALPIDAAAKDALIRGASAARALAEGKRVDHILLDQALAALPVVAKKAAQIGVAVASAKVLQQGMKAIGRAVAPTVGQVLRSGVMSKAGRQVLRQTGIDPQKLLAKTGQRTLQKVASSAVRQNTRRLVRQSGLQPVLRLPGMFKTVDPSADGLIAAAMQAQGFLRG